MWLSTSCSWPASPRIRSTAGVRSPPPGSSDPRGGSSFESTGAAISDVRHDLLEEIGDVIVVELVDHPTPVALARDQPEMPEDPQLMRDRQPSMPTLAAIAVTDAGPAWSRARIRSRLGVASACTLSAAVLTNDGSSRRRPMSPWSAPCAMTE